MLLRRSSNFCSCTTWYLDLDDLRGINRVCLYKESEVSALQANTQLARKWECWIWNQRFIKDFKHLLDSLHLWFQSPDRTAQECADWSDSTPPCNAFAVVDPQIRPGIHRCYLKHIVYIPSTASPGTLIYYRLTGEPRTRGWKWRNL